MNCIDDYKVSKPVTFRNAVEKDCVFDQRRGRAEIREVSVPIKVECFNCRGNHFLRDCKEPRQLKCYGCGKLGVTRKDCCGSGQMQKRKESESSVEGRLDSEMSTSSQEVRTNEVAVVLSVKEVKRLYFPVRINETYFQGLHDSRANACVIGRKGWEKLENELPEFQSSSEVVRVADGRAHRVAGIVKLPVVFDSVKLPI